MLLRALGTYPVAYGLPFVLQAFGAFFLIGTPSAHVDDVGCANIHISNLEAQFRNRRRKRPIFSILPNIIHMK